MYKKYKSLGLRNKIVIPIIITIILGVAVILITLLSSFSKIATSLSNEILIETSQHYSNLVQKDDSSKFSLLSSLNKTIEEAGKKGTMNRDEVISFLQRSIQEDDSILGIFTCWEPNAFDGKDNNYINLPLYDETGRFMTNIVKHGSEFYKEPLSNFNKGIDDYYSKVKSSGKSIVLDPFKYKIGDKNVFITSIVEPLYIDEKFVGVIGINVSLDSLNEVLSKVNVFDSGYVYLISQNGTLATYPNSELIGQSIYDYATSTACDVMKKAISTGSEEKFTAKKLGTGEDILTTIVPLEMGNTGINWGIGVTVLEKEVMAPITTQVTLGLIIGCIVTFAALLLLFKIINGITKEIYSLDQRLFQSSSYVSSASVQLASASQEVSDGSNEQAASIEETSASMEETTSMVQKNAENTKIASELSEKTRKSANIGASKMNAMVKDMKDIEESSNQISKIIKVINDIAFQTNILALNAAVEAARAGDAGQGFAVVAEEVRNLAQKSSEAAKNTSEIIEKNIQLSTKGANVSEEVKESLDDIIIEIEKVNKLVAEIAASSNEQIGGTTQVNNAMTNIEQVVQKNAAAAEESAAAAEELQAQANELENVVHRINMLVKGAKAKQFTFSKNNKNNKVLYKNKIESSSNGKQEKIHTKNKNSKKENNLSPEEIIPLNDDNEF